MWTFCECFKTFWTNTKQRKGVPSSRLTYSTVIGTIATHSNNVAARRWKSNSSESDLTTGAGGNMRKYAAGLISEWLTPCSAAPQPAESSGLEPCGRKLCLSARAAVPPCEQMRQLQRHPCEIVFSYWPSGEFTLPRNFFYCFQNFFFLLQLKGFWISEDCLYTSHWWWVTKMVYFIMGEKVLYILCRYI